MTAPMTLNRLVERCQQEMAHAWVARAFVRHCDEVEDFPELAEIGRAIFDISRALEPSVDDPASYFKMLGKKLGKFRTAVEKFEKDALAASSHTNFVQTVISLRSSVSSLQDFLSEAQMQLAAQRNAN